MLQISRRELLAWGGSAALATGLPDAAIATEGKRFVTANNSPYDTLDPHAVFDIGRIASRLNMYDCLVRWVDNPPRLDLWLASRIDVSPDGMTYTVALKPDAKFHDGAPVTADDVVFSMERILGLKQGAYGLFKSVIEPQRLAEDRADRNAAVQAHGDRRASVHLRRHVRRRDWQRMIIRQHWRRRAALVRGEGMLHPRWHRRPQMPDHMPTHAPRIHVRSEACGEARVCFGGEHDRGADAGVAAPRAVYFDRRP